MFTDKIADYRRGEIFFTAEEGFPELFLSLCSQSSVKVRNVKINAADLSGTVYAGDMDALNRAALKSGMKITVLREKGLRQLFEKVKQRAGIPIGFFAAVLIFSILSGMIWSVDISGCTVTDEQVVEEILSGCGLKRGGFLINADAKLAERLIASSTPGIYRAVVNASGSRVFVNIVENTVPEPVKQKGTYSNITAKTDGVISDIDIFSGTSALKAGDEVKKGDLLVSGITELSDGRLMFSESKARIMAFTQHKVRVAATEHPKVNKVKSCRDFYSPYVFGLCLINFRKEEDCVSYESYFAESFDTVFPLGVMRRRKTVFTEEEIELPEQRVYLIAIHDLACVAVSKIGKLSVPEREIKVEKKGNFSIEAVFCCEEEIGKEEEAEFFGTESENVE